MANVSAVWGIDVGQCALKALRLQVAADGAIEVTHFDIIEHPKILSQPDAETEQLIRNALDKFLSRNEIGPARVVLSVPGQSSFARFIKLPPVEPKRIPEIVRFEAVQQIPFDIEEVEWDYQTFVSPRSPDVEVGIFAMRKELVLKHLSYLREAGIEADIVQLAPLALFNMMIYDGQTAKQGATILIDVGAENTDLVISDGDRIWLRSIPLGGNNFTESLVKAFKLPFSKAESLKRTAATSKYARQIFVAMRPVFGDLVGEVQRSIGFYTSLHRDAQMSRVLCMGNAFRLPGLQKYLEQNLQVDTVRPDTFNRLKPSATINAPAFAENIRSFGVAYGLGLQGLEESPIQANLLPLAIHRERNWRSMRPWFAAAAAVTVFGVGLASWAATSTNRSVLDTLRAAQGRANKPLADHQRIQKQVQDRKDKGAEEKKHIGEIKQIIAYRDTVLQLMYLVQNSVPNEWRAKARELAAAKSNLAADQVDWHRHVWPLIGQPDVQKDNKDLQVYLLEQVELKFFRGKPPERKRETAPPGGPAAGPVGPTAFAPEPLPQAPVGPLPGAGVSRGDRDRYFRVTIVGLTNVQGDRIASDITERFLGRMLALKRFDASQPAGDQSLASIELDEKDLARALRGYVSVAPPDTWPPLGGAAAPAGGGNVAPRGAPAAAPAAGQPETETYQVLRFTVGFDVKIVPPPAGTQETPNRTGRAP